MPKLQMVNPQQKVAKAPTDMSTEKYLSAKEAINSLTMSNMADNNTIVSTGDGGMRVDNQGIFGDITNIQVQSNKVPNKPGSDKDGLQYGNVPSNQRGTTVAAVKIKTNILRDGTQSTCDLLKQGLLDSLGKKQSTRYWYEVVNE
ncbi:hypothetical protein LRP49_03730 [Enterovibrio sp. ZSDZ35]|uniref:Uncharacterized protein n=1 Tax=Enterovibrio qingdaonensis TaxID=2899818 RepID=A0ABT5QHI2_9GAMM|nr:hypothetical protein [Enterovibrio sp. ZSDZ35]MDD1780304.1 hypothetical protein [Enterovibrio sp. ZSDZ35]